MAFARHASRLFLLGFLFAAGQNSAVAACLTTPVNADAIAAFKSNPPGLIERADGNVSALEIAVRNLVGTDAELAAEIVSIAKFATSQQKSAIAAGLAQAALACVNNTPKSALLIQEAVAGLDDASFQATFAAIAGDLDTGAIAAAQTAASGSTGSTAGSGPNTGSTISGTGATTRGTTSGIFGTVSFSQSTTGRTSATTVSPSQ